ncbi:PadR family transcriptional regulator [Pengzhenrongella sp.]|uniref:PadR family transcriptional regulator n=1 Tax=Pengzhenrongella sp. TaxID=2888820 RepID=UPI002F94507A
MALLAGGPRHGYDLKRAHDAWFPGGKPLAFGQVYATVARLERDGLVEQSAAVVVAGPERIVYALTPAGTDRVQQWLSEPSEPTSLGNEEFVRRAVAAMRTGRGPAFLALQRSAHLARMRALLVETAPGAAGRGTAGAGTGEDLPARLVREHAVAHLDADLRWLEAAAEQIAAEPPAPDAGESPIDHPADHPIDDLEKPEPTGPLEGSR